MYLCVSRSRSGYLWIYVESVTFQWSVNLEYIIHGNVVSSVSMKNRSLIGWLSKGSITKGGGGVRKENSIGKRSNDQGSSLSLALSYCSRLHEQPGTWCGCYTTAPRHRLHCCMVSKIRQSWVWGLVVVYTKYNSNPSNFCSLFSLLIISNQSKGAFINYVET